MLIVFVVRCLSFYLNDWFVISILDDELEGRDNFEYAAMIVVLHLTQFKIVYN